MKIVKQYTEETKQNGTNQLAYYSTIQQKQIVCCQCCNFECKITLGGHTHKKHRLHIMQ